MLDNGKVKSCILVYCNIPDNTVVVILAACCFLHCRQLTIRGVVRAFQFVENYAEAQRLLAIISKVADDPGNFNFHNLIL